MIEDIIIFYSNHSKSSQECLVFADFQKIPFKKIDIDKSSIRNKINGGKISITNVPTLLLSHSDGTVQLFVGKPKIINIINKLTSPPPNNPVKKDEDVDKKSGKSNSQDNLNKSDKIVRFEDPGEIEFLSDGESNPSQQKIAPRTQKDEKSMSLRKKVDEMMAEREKTLGYSNKNQQSFA